MWSRHTTERLCLAHRKVISRVTRNDGTFILWKASYHEARQSLERCGLNIAEDSTSVHRRACFGHLFASESVHLARCFQSSLARMTWAFFHGTLLQRGRSRLVGMISLRTNRTAGIHSKILTDRSFQRSCGRRINRRLVAIEVRNCDKRRRVWLITVCRVRSSSTPDTCGLARASYSGCKRERRTVGSDSGSADARIEALAAPAPPFRRFGVP